jgi:hypothetical protein
MRRVESNLFNTNLTSSGAKAQSELNLMSRLKPRPTRLVGRAMFVGHGFSRAVMARDQRGFSRWPVSTQDDAGRCALGQRRKREVQKQSMQPL